MRWIEDMRTRLLFALIFILRLAALHLRMIPAKPCSGSAPVAGIKVWEIDAGEVTGALDSQPVLGLFVDFCELWERFYRILPPGTRFTGKRKRKRPGITPSRFLSALTKLLQPGRLEIVIFRGAGAGLTAERGVEIAQFLQQRLFIRRKNRVRQFAFRNGEARS